MMTALQPGLWVPPTIPTMLNRAVAERPTAPALIRGDLTLNYQDYGRCVDALAQHFEPGQTVVLLLRNSIAIAIALFAIHKAGAISAALNPDYTARELAPMVACAAPDWVIVHSDLIDRITELLPDNAALYSVGSDQDFVADLLGEPDVKRTEQPQADAIAVLQFTGGTTGVAKGVELTQQAVAMNVAQREAVLPTEFGNERILCFMPMFHSFAAAMCVHLSAYAAGTLVILPRYRPDWVMDAIKQHQITRLPAGPTVFNGLLDYAGLERDAVSTLRSAWSGSAPLSRDTLARWDAATGVPIYEGYGQSEAGPVLTYQGPGFGNKPGSVGRALPATEIKIAQDGEILARGPQVMRGYRDNPAATAEALIDGWLHTGDMGRIDSDGDVFVEDRKKDMAIVGGFNVYPREIDEVLMTHPDVSLAAAVGTPDAYRGEIIIAFVVAAEGCTPSSENILAHCAANLVRYKLPASIRIVEALPLTSVGKIDKVALRTIAASKETANVA
jgi:long-chain acyl-CoA synthetase